MLSVSFSSISKINFENLSLRTPEIASAHARRIDLKNKYNPNLRPCSPKRVQHRQAMGSCEKCTLSGPAPDLLKENLPFVDTSPPLPHLPTAQVSLQVGGAAAESLAPNKGQSPGLADAGCSLGLCVLPRSSGDSDSGQHLSITAESCKLSLQYGSRYPRVAIYM